MISNQERPNKRQCLVRMPNWLGDVVMALPSLYYLLEQQYELTLVGQPWLKHIIPIECNIISLKDANLKTKLKLNKNKDYLLLTNSFSSAWQAKSTGKHAYGYRTDMRSLLLKRSWPKPSGLHESQIFLYLVEMFLNHTPNINMQRIVEYLPDRSLLGIPNAADNTYDISKLNVSSDAFVLLCPFAAGLSPDKQSKIWPHWVELVQQLVQTTQVICCPLPNEMPQAKQLQQVGATILSDINLMHYQQLMQKSQYVIGNDTGPMHLAALYNSKTLTLFGVTDPERTHPLRGDYLGSCGQWPSLEGVLSFISGAWQSLAKKC